MSKPIWEQTEQDLPADVPPGKIRIYARVENYYIETGDEIETWPVADLPLPPAPLPEDGNDASDEVDQWLQEELFALTGTGRTKGDATYDLEVRASSRPDLVPIGFTHEWGY